MENELFVMLETGDSVTRKMPASMWVLVIKFQLTG